MKVRPNSVLGSIASSSRKRVKEIERYVYEEDVISYPNARRQQGYRGRGGDARQGYSEDDVRMPRPREMLPPSDQYQYTESRNSGYDDDSYLSDDQGRYNDDDNSRSRPPPPTASARDPQRRTDYEEYNNRDDRYAAARGRQNRFSDEDYPPHRRPRVDYHDDDDSRAPYPPQRRPRADYYDDDDSRSPYPPQRRPRLDLYDDYVIPGWGGGRSFGSRNVDYLSMNRPFDRRRGSGDREYTGYNTQQIRPPRLNGEFTGENQSRRRRGYVGQSLIDYQVKPPSRRGRREPDDIEVIDVRSSPPPPFDFERPPHRYDNNNRRYFEPY